MNHGAAATDYSMHSPWFLYGFLAESALSRLKRGTKRNVLAPSP
jgi:hypothetical protein